nr:uroporphyrinogen-III synthase [Bordetella genomosp. 13]
MSPIAILTRPAGRNEALAQRLSAAGWHSLCLPALAIEPLPADGPPPLPHDYDLVVFVSGNAARLYLDRVAPHLPQGWPAGCVAATVGPGSARVLADSGLLGAAAVILHPPAHAPAHDSEALWQLLSARPLPRRALLVRGTQGRDWLSDQLAAAGVAVTRHAVYRRLPAAWPADAVQALRAWAGQGVPATWLLTSGEGIAATADAVRAAGLLQWWRGCRFVLTHPRLAGALRVALAVPQGMATPGMTSFGVVPDNTASAPAGSADTASAASASLAAAPAAAAPAAAASAAKASPASASPAAASAVAAPVAAVTPGNDVLADMVVQICMPADEAIFEAFVAA